ncbi:aryl-alcohol dehydrogenase-like predicted oxidoreductase [Friedmanniella endophytica]|uniref:Aryl-alcohol dehydrogenase-like predicted oxidoreductase n=1 Tax=Microlunatus kandeliicorticis TaxID=1759536 RepID=A0A7W3IS00_9ACTN|nr:aldo/keto reductase [Microlunatus kandeliicorticis]MBA8794166.1 aryl-alcohol dehydrogenase-like predicted oxidoreductase [Microlunatus kandeliicorticis]
MTAQIPTRPFGRTGHDSTRVIFGAAALGAVTQDEADQTLDLVRQHGINHLDVAHSYGDAEERMGPFVAEHRDEFFLATKTGERTAEAAWAEINQSLERLRTDHLDLIQLHNLVDEQEWQTAFAKGGALEAAVRAKDEGLVANIGVTGHGVTVARQHLRSLAEYDFASVLLPYNFPMTRNAAYIADFEELSALCAERGVAMQTIKSITRAPWDEALADSDKFASTWYEPLRDPSAIETAVAWVLGREGVFLNTVGDIHILPLVIAAAEKASEHPGRPDDEAMGELERAWEMAPLFV